jgi:hypothetical protein
VKECVESLTLDVTWHEKVFISGRYPHLINTFFRSYYIQCWTLSIPESLCSNFNHIVEKERKKIKFFRNRRRDVMIIFLNLIVNRMSKDFPRKTRSK